jgi:hypothetical protein
LTLLIESPLAADPRSVYRLFQKWTIICGSFHAASDQAVFELLAGVRDWVRGRGASLVVEKLRAQ